MTVAGFLEAVSKFNDMVDELGMSEEVDSYYFFKGCGCGICDIGDVGLARIKWVNGPHGAVLLKAWLLKSRASLLRRKKKSK